MRCQTLAEVAQHEWKRAIGVSRKSVHVTANPAKGKKIRPNMFRLIE